MTQISHRRTQIEAAVHAMKPGGGTDANARSTDANARSKEADARSKEADARSKEAHAASCQGCKGALAGPMEGTTTEEEAEFAAVFKVALCSTCRHGSGPYELVTKAGAKERFLLTDEELDDAALLPYLARRNPHSPWGAPMRLYLQCHLQAFADRKWGAAEGIAAEARRRLVQKDRIKERRFAAKLSDLRRRALAKAPGRRAAASSAASHRHSFAPPQPGAKGPTSTCLTCGLVVECEEF